MLKILSQLSYLKLSKKIVCTILVGAFMLTASPLQAQEQLNVNETNNGAVEMPAAAIEAVPVGKPELLTSTPVTDGAILKQYNWQTTKGPVKIFVTEIDLRNPYIELAAIPGKGKLTERLNVTAMARNTKAVAAINGDYYNTSGEGVPIGPMATDGRLLASPAKLSGWHALGITDKRQAYIESFTFTGQVTAPDGAEFELAGLNKTAYWEQPDGSHSHVDKLHLYNDLWGGKTRGEDSYSTPTEILVEDGKVTDIIEGEYFNFAVPEGAYILRGHEKAAEFLLNNFQIGTPIDIDYEISPDQNWTTIIGGYSLLVDKGKTVSLSKDVLASLDGLRARSAAGISKDGKTIYLVGVEGRTETSKGLSLGNLATFFEELGAWQAINFDGGGSSTMAVRPLGEWQAERVFAPEQTNERLVVNALGVYSTAPQGKPQGLIIPNSPVALIGETIDFSLKAYDQYFNPLDVEKLPVIWTKNGEVGTLNGNQFVANRPGLAEITAGVDQASTRLALEVVGKREVNRLNLTANRTGQIALGQPVSLTLTLQTATGKTRQIPTALIDWQFNNLKGEVSPDGKLTVREAGSSGNGIVVARYQGFSAPLPLTISKEVPIPTLNQSEELSFLSYPEEVTGEIRQVADPSSGKDEPVIALEYNFTKVTDDVTAAAYLKLGADGILIDQEAKNLALDVYGNKGIQWLRAELVDAAGNISRVDLANPIDWEGWQTIALDTSKLTNKPLTLKRIYVVTTDREQEQKASQGTLLFKNLRLRYDRQQAPTAKHPVSLKLTIGQKQMTVNNTPMEMDVAPVIVSGRTLVPVRFISQALNGIVLWDGKTNNATILQAGNWIDLWLEDQLMVVNGQAETLDVAPELINDRTMLPLRALAETLGLTVQWHPETQGITLSK